MGRVLPQPLAVRQSCAKHTRSKLHRGVFLDDSRERRNRSLGNSGIRLSFCLSRVSHIRTAGVHREFFLLLVFYFPPPKKKKNTKGKNPFWASGVVRMV